MPVQKTEKIAHKLFYRRTIAKLSSATDNKPLAWLTLEDIQLFCDRLEQEELSDSSRRGLSSN